MFNALFVLIVFLMQLNKDKIHISWPFGIKTNISFVEETGEVGLFNYFVFFFLCFLLVLCCCCCFPFCVSPVLVLSFSKNKNKNLPRRLICVSRSLTPSLGTSQNNSSRNFKPKITLELVSTFSLCFSLFKSCLAHTQSAPAPLVNLRSPNGFFLPQCLVDACLPLLC